MTERYEGTINWAGAADQLGRMLQAAAEELSIPRKKITINTRWSHDREDNMRVVLTWECKIAREMTLYIGVGNTPQDAINDAVYAFNHKLGQKEVAS